MRDKSQIADAIVGTVTVDVVNRHPRRNGTMYVFPDQTVCQFEGVPDPQVSVPFAVVSADIACDFVDSTGFSVYDQFRCHKIFLKVFDKCIARVIHFQHRHRKFSSS